MENGVWSIAAVPVCNWEMGRGMEEKGKGGGGRYLCATGSVLCSTAGYKLCAVVVEEVFVEAHVLFFREYGVVGLETVLGQHCFIAR